MTFTDDELMAIIEEVTLTLGEVLLNHRHLTEAFIEDHGIEQTQDQIADRKQEIEKLKDRIRKSKEVIRHRREIDQLRKQHEAGAEKSTQSETAKKLETISDQGGRVVGYKLQHGKQTVYMNSKQRVVAREVGGNTFNRNGSYIGKGQQGLRALNQG